MPTYLFRITRDAFEHGTMTIQAETVEEAAKTINEMDPYDRDIEWDGFQCDSPIDYVDADSLLEVLEDEEPEEQDEEALAKEQLHSDLCEVLRLIAEQQDSMAAEILRDLISQNKPY